VTKGTCHLQQEQEEERVVKGACQLQQDNYLGAIKEESGVSLMTSKDQRESNDAKFMTEIVPDEYRRTKYETGITA
jgi:hypothetical protein